MVVWQDTLPDDLLVAVLQAVIQDAGIKPSAIEDICIGNTLQLPSYPQMYTLTVVKSYQVFSRTLKFRLLIYKRLV